MEQTESVVIQVAPGAENDKIKEMEAFGWNLQGRQEIHEKGDAFGRPSYIDSGTYVVKTTVYQYVKVHFVRPKSLPNIAKIRELENEYQALPFPAPVGLLGPVVFTLVPILAMFVWAGQPHGPEEGAWVTAVVWAALGAFWVWRRALKRRSSSSLRAQSGNRARDIVDEALKLTAA